MSVEDTGIKKLKKNKEQKFEILEIRALDGI